MQLIRLLFPAACFIDVVISLSCVSLVGAMLSVLVIAVALDGGDCNYGFRIFAL